MVDTTSSVRGRAQRRPQSARTRTEMRASRGPAGIVAAALLAGWMFAIAQMALSGAFTPNPLWPWRAAASVIIGSTALDATGPVAALIVGFVTHAALSVAFGGLYLLGSERFLPESWRRGRWRRAATGTLFGLGLYLVNFQIIARAFYPWFLEPSQLLQALVHAFVFGMPLGFMAAALESRLPVFAHRRV